MLQAWLRLGRKQQGDGEEEAEAAAGGGRSMYHY